MDAAQQMLGLAGRINMIQALECNCASIERLAEIQAEISALLGNEVQVIELATKAIARAKLREGVKAEGQATIARQERFASAMLPLVIVGASILVGLLSLVNVRERRAEIGILRAIKTKSVVISTYFTSDDPFFEIGWFLIGYLANGFR